LSSFTRTRHQLPGFDSDGIKILDEVLVEAGHEVWICAPSENKSSTSHSLSFLNGKNPIEVERHKYRFDGQPADCMMVALGRKAICFNPDVVVSGINAGFNLSIDILYSGTFGAAAEASLWGYKSIAISAEKPTDENKNIYYSAARFLEEHLEEFVGRISNSVVLNINVPQNSNGISWKIGKQFTMVHRDAAFPNDAGVLKNGVKDMERGVTDSDLAVCASGEISVTPIDVCPSVSEKAIDNLDLMLNLR